MLFLGPNIIEIALQKLREFDSCFHRDLAIADHNLTKHTLFNF